MFGFASGHIISPLSAAGEAHSHTRNKVELERIAVVQKHATLSNLRALVALTLYIPYATMTIVCGSPSLDHWSCVLGA